MNMLGSLTFLIMHLSTVMTPLFLQGCSNATCGEGLVSEKTSPSDLNNKILEILNATKPCESLDDCDTVEVSLVPKSRKKTSSERILVIDGGIRLAAYTRYKSKVLDHLIANEDGKYVSNPQKIRVPRPIFEVLSNLLDEQNADTPAFHLNDVAGEFVKHLKCVDSNSAHGSEIFGTLADLNPEAEFVIADLIDSYRSGFCEFYTSKDAREKYKTQLRTASSSLSTQIMEHEIEYVNMSLGHEREVLEDRWTRFCSGKVPDSFFELQKTFFTEFYEPLFANKEVVFVQAAPYSRFGLLENVDPEFYSDSQNIDNRLAVSGFSEIDPKLPILGSNNTDYLKDFFKGPWNSVDVYINFGVMHERPYRKGPFPVLLSTEGVGADALFDRPSTSSATPVGLSYLNYLKKSGLIKGSGQELVSNFKNYHQGKLVEPARYKQFEIYRLGRLP